MPAIIGFEIKAEIMDNVFKLSQNKGEKSYLNIISKLEAQGLNSASIALEMKKRKAELFRVGKRGMRVNLSREMLMLKDFRTVLERVRSTKIGIYGIDSWKDGVCYYAFGFEDYGDTTPLDPHWYLTSLMTSKRLEKPFNMQRHTLYLKGLWKILNKGGDQVMTYFDLERGNR